MKNNDITRIKLRDGKMEWYVFVILILLLGLSMFSLFIYGWSSDDFSKIEKVEIIALAMMFFGYLLYELKDFFIDKRERISYIDITNSEIILVYKGMKILRRDIIPFYEIKDFFAYLEIEEYYCNKHTYCRYKTTITIKTDKGDITFEESDGSISFLSELIAESKRIPYFSYKIGGKYPNRHKDIDYYLQHKKKILSSLLLYFPWLRLNSFGLYTILIIAISFFVGLVSWCLCYVFQNMK